MPDVNQADLMEDMWVWDMLGRTASPRGVVKVVNGETYGYDPFPTSALYSSDAGEGSRVRQQLYREWEESGRAGPEPDIAAAGILSEHIGQYGGGYDTASNVRGVWQGIRDRAGIRPFSSQESQAEYNRGLQEADSRWAQTQDSDNGFLGTGIPTSFVLIAAAAVGGSLLAAGAGAGGAAATADAAAAGWDVAGIGTEAASGGAGAIASGSTSAAEFAAADAAQLASQGISGTQLEQLLVQSTGDEFLAADLAQAVGQGVTDVAQLTALANQSLGIVGGATGAGGAAGAGALAGGAATSGGAAAGTTAAAAGATAAGAGAGGATSGAGFALPTTAAGWASLLTQGVGTAAALDALFSDRGRAALDAATEQARKAGTYYDTLAGIAQEQWNTYKTNVIPKLQALSGQRLNEEAFISRAADEAKTQGDIAIQSEKRSLELTRNPASPSYGATLAPMYMSEAAQVNKAITDARLAANTENYNRAIREVSAWRGFPQGTPALSSAASGTGSTSTALTNIGNVEANRAAQGAYGGFNLAANAAKWYGGDATAATRQPVTTSVGGYMDPEAAIRAYDPYAMTPGYNRSLYEQAGYPYAEGGAIRGPGGPTSDSVHTAAREGDFIVPADVVRAKGTNYFDKMLEKHGMRAGATDTGGGDVAIRASDGEYRVPREVVAREGEEFFHKLMQKYHRPVFGDSGMANGGAIRVRTLPSSVEHAISRSMAPRRYRDGGEVEEYIGRREPLPFAISPEQHRRAALETATERMRYRHRSPFERGIVDIRGRARQTGSMEEPLPPEAEGLHQLPDGTWVRRM